MRIREQASRFTTYVFDTGIEHGAGVKVALAQAGYDAFFFESLDTLYTRVGEKPPHIIVFPTESVRANMSDFFERLLKLNPEVRLIAIAKPDQTEALAAYNDYGLADILTDEAEGLPSRAVFAVDRACEKLYLTYQNEQLLEKWEQEKAKHLDTQNTARSSGEAAARVGPPLEDRIKDYRTAASKEDLLRRFMQIMGSTPCLFLKYLPTVRSLVVTHASTLDPDKLQGIGAQLQPAEAKDFATQVTLGVVPPSLEEVLVKIFEGSGSRLRPLFVKDLLEGVLAIPSNLPGADKNRLDDEFSLMALAYSALTLEKRVEVLETLDNVTEVTNRKFYQQRLKEEWNRSRRIRQPLSVVKIALDDFFELEQTLGENTRDTILRNVAQLLTKTSRNIDFVSRTGQNEFALILPHAPRQGAMIRAERVRRLVESSQMVDNGLKVSVSVGISEYPTLCMTDQELDVTSTKALLHVAEKGGNRLCLFKAPAHHQPEFEVAAEPTGS